MASLQVWNERTDYCSKNMYARRPALVMPSRGGFCARRTLSAHLSLAACRCHCDRIVAVWQVSRSRSDGVHQVDLAATLRHLGRAGDILVVRLVAAARRVAAVRGEAAELHLETSHLRGAKEPWRHTNHKKPEAQMARYDLV